MGYPYRFFPDALLMNRGDGTFEDRAKAFGLDPMPGGNFLPTRIGGNSAARSSRAAATADFDGDGRVDVIVDDFNDRPMLLVNRWPARPWIGLKLVGTRNNKDAVGAVARLKVGGRTLTRQVQAAGGYLAQSSLTLHFALGDATKVDACEVTWPGGRKQVVTDLALGRVNRVVEAR